MLAPLPWLATPDSEAKCGVYVQWAVQDFIDLAAVYCRASETSEKLARVTWLKGVGFNAKKKKFFDIQCRCSPRPS